VIEQAAQEWRDLCAAFTQYTAHLDRNSAVNVNSATLRYETKRIAQMYFRGVRQSLQQFQLDEFVEPLSIAFEALLVLSEGRNLASSYKKHTKVIRKIIPRVTSQLEVQGGQPNAQLYRNRSEDTPYPGRPSTFGSAILSTSPT
jgi:hypothetical protein